VVNNTTKIEKSQNAKIERLIYTKVLYNIQMIKLGAKELRVTKSTEKDRAQVKKNQVYIILDNVMDTYNIGAIFRLADAVAATGVYLCGSTETPPNSRIKKSSINTTEWVEWQYFKTTKDAIKQLRSKVPGIKIYSVEQDEKSILYNSFKYEMPFALIVGHETSGVSKEVLDLSDEVVEMPMWGVNKSLNVMVSLGIVLYEAMSDKGMDNY